MQQKLIRFYLSQDDYAEAMDKAVQNGFDNVSDYAIFRIFGRPTAPPEYPELLDKFSKSVKENPHKVRFRVRDMFEPNEWNSLSIGIRRGLGRIIYQKVQKGWLPLVDDGKDSANAQWYKRTM